MPYLEGPLIKLQSSHSICLNRGVKLKINTLYTEINLAFEQKPDYKYLKSLFDITFIDMSFKLDYEFCWHTKKVQILEHKLKLE